MPNGAASEDAGSSIRNLLKLSWRKKRGVRKISNSPFLFGINTITNILPKPQSRPSTALHAHALPRRLTKS